MTIHFTPCTSQLVYDDGIFADFFVQFHLPRPRLPKKHKKEKRVDCRRRALVPTLFVRGRVAGLVLIYTYDVLGENQLLRNA